MRLRAAPSPARSPCRVAGQSATCIAPAKDFPDLLSGRRHYARQRWHKVQESFYGDRPCQAAVRLRSTTRAGSTTGLLSSTLFRPPPEQRACCTPFHCAAIFELTCGAKRRAPCGSMVFHQTCLQTPCPRPDSYLRSRSLLDGSLVKNHTGLRPEQKMRTDGAPGLIQRCTACAIYGVPHCPQFGRSTRFGVSGRVFFAPGATSSSIALPF
ncbi:hypothetical protein ES705_36534 [subsurface metagenome]